MTNRATLAATNSLYNLSMSEPRQPHDYPRRILLCVTGLSPQIVTETLYALAIEHQPAFVPTEVHLLTTSEGAKLAQASLLHPDGGQFLTLFAEWPQLARPTMDTETIHVIAGPDGQPLTDIRTPAENTAAADAIASVVRDLTRDPESAVHVSIAGGRKTMGFYLGYALSLYARPQDRLSHVLVSAPFESHPEFFYPPRQPRRLATRDGHHIDTADARVTLAEIPFVRLRHGLPEALLQGKARFSEAVSAIQQSLAPPHLLIDLGKRRVVCGNTTVAMKPQLLAWLAWWAILVQEGRPETAWRDADANLFLAIYRAVVGIDAVDYEKIATLLGNGMEKEFFQTKNAKLERVLKDALGLAAAPYLLVATGKRPHTRRGLTLPPESIHISGFNTHETKNPVLM